MPHFLVDDGFAFHRKAVAAGNAAIGLWTRAGAWCRQQLSDGHVPAHIARTLGTTKEARTLVAVGLWREVEDGYEFHEWDGRQTTKEEVLAKRAAARERMEKARARSREVRANKHRTSREVRSTPSPSPSPSPDNYVSDGADEPPAASAQALVAEWLERSPKRPPGDVVGQVGKRLKALLADGIDLDDIRRGLADWDRKGLHPSALPSVVHEAQKANGSNVVHLPDGRVKLPPLPPSSPWGDQ